MYNTHRHKKLSVLWYGILCLLLLCPSASNAGLFSALSKISKVTKKADVDIPLNKIELPDNIKDFSPAIARPDADGQWNITLADGTTIHIDDLLKQPERGKSKLALLIRSQDLPDHIKQFDNLPDDLPVFIQGKKNRLFELKRGESAALAYNNVLLPVKNINDIKDGLWMLQRPSMNKTVRFFQLAKRPNSILQNNTYGSSFTVESATADSLIDSIKSFKNQTLVLSGRIIDGKLFGSGKNSSGLLMKKLQKAAEDNDIHLVILDTDKPDLLLKKIAHSMQQAFQNNHIQHDTTADFFNRLVDPINPNQLELQLSHSGKTQMAIQWKANKTDMLDVTNTPSEILKHMPAHLLLHSALSHTPDQQRSKELHDRIIPGISSDIQLYVIASIILGFTALGTSWKLWKKIWFLKARSEYSHLILFFMLWPVHRLLFLLLFIPALGMFSFFWLVISIIYRVFNFIFIRPSRWMYRVIRT